MKTQLLSCVISNINFSIFQPTSSLLLCNQCHLHMVVIAFMSASSMSWWCVYFCISRRHIQSLRTIFYVPEKSRIQVQEQSTLHLMLGRCVEA